MSKKTVLIIDDHPVFREGIKSILVRSSRFEVIGEAENAIAGLKKTKRLKPDLVIMDLSLPDQSGADVTYEIRSLLPDTRVMVMSVHAGIDYIADAFRKGASGYVTKESTTEKLIECLETIARDDYFIDSSIAHLVVKEIIESRGKEQKIVDRGYKNLTSREQEIMQLIVQGHSTKQIADKLFISTKTVENHRSSILKKLDLHSTLELVRYAARIGMINVDLWKS
jgi:DNA-binding NarL/FixJ family response regulator